MLLLLLLPGAALAGDSWMIDGTELTQESGNKPKEYRH